MNPRKRSTVAHRTRPSGRQRTALLGFMCLSLLVGAAVAVEIGLGQMAKPPSAPVAAAVPDIPEGVLVMRHGTQIERYVSAEPTILCPDGTVRPMSNYRHVCEPGWRQP